MSFGARFRNAEGALQIDEGFSTYYIANRGQATSRFVDPENPYDLLSLRSPVYFFHPINAGASNYYAYYPHWLLSGGRMVMGSYKDGPFKFIIASLTSKNIREGDGAFGMKVAGEDGLVSFDSRWEFLNIHSIHVLGRSNKTITLPPPPPGKDYYFSADALRPMSSYRYSTYDEEIYGFALYKVNPYTFVVLHNALMYEVSGMFTMWDGEADASHQSTLMVALA